MTDKRIIKTDVCIIGAGPAGLFAAITAAESGAKPVVVEKNTTACRKLMYTGGKRCNFTHTGSVDDFIKAYDTFGRFLRPALHEFSADDLRNYFAKQGLAAKVEKDGCVFPVTDRASDVVRILTSHARRLGINFLYDKEVQAIEKDGDNFEVNTGAARIDTAAVIIAAGGMTWPFTGSTGDGYKFAASLGHSIIEPKASLVPLVTAEKWPGTISGVSVPNVVIRTKLGKRKICVCGALIFTGEGIGGFAAFDLSRFITDFLPDYENPVKIVIDLLPEFDVNDLENQIISLCSEHPKKELAGVLAEFLPRSLMLNLCQQINPSQTVLAGSLTKETRKQIVKLLKELPLSIVATRPIADATVTRGGVSTSEIDPKTMESKLCKGLFFAGEVINADGPCGGFNLQIAFSTGYLAGKKAAQISQ
ncbi:MAG: NAD(P)/FAD-dependent oxidoreductase [Phycisphaerae bacterium]|nr:NAD(P)/FAD-dependent oxidoreductase [Phycisphaerae bacterium]